MQTTKAHSRELLTGLEITPKALDSSRNDEVLLVCLLKVEAGRWWQTTLYRHGMDSVVTHRNAEPIMV